MLWIENLEQSEFLRAQGCDKSQGYFYSQPLAAAQITPLLVRQERQPRRAAAEAMA